MKLLNRLTNVARTGAPWPRLAGPLACAAGFVLCVAAFYPGYMSPDSLRQLAEGRAWSFTDWHPPLMAAVWGLADRIVPGPFGMLLLHNAAFWGALAVFWRTTYRRSLVVGLCLVGLGFTPTALALLSTVWKDVGLGASLLLACALLHTSRLSGSKLALLLSVPLLFYGYGVRQNAAPAILPLAVWSCYVALRLFRPSRAKAGGLAAAALPLALGLAYFLLLTAAVLTTTRALTGGRSSYIYQVVLLHDLAAVSKERGQPLFPDYLTRGASFSLEGAAASYRPDMSMSVFRAEAAGMRLTKEAGEVAALRAKWLEVVPANRSVYLRHRWEAFKALTALGRGEVCFPYLSNSRALDGRTINRWRVHQLMRVVFWKLRDTFFFRGYWFLLASLALLCLSLAGRLRDDLETVFVMSLSGLLYGAGYFFYGTSCDFRFTWWTALASLVGACLLTLHAFERRRARRVQGADV